jgi:hypothetical protein
MWNTICVLLLQRDVNVVLSIPWKKITADYVQKTTLWRVQLPFNHPSTGKNNNTLSASFPEKVKTIPFENAAIVGIWNTNLTVKHRRTAAGTSMKSWTTTRITTTQIHNVIVFVENVYYVIRWNASFYVPDPEHMEYLSQRLPKTLSWVWPTPCEATCIVFCSSRLNHICLSHPYNEKCTRPSEREAICLTPGGIKTNCLDKHLGKTQLTWLQPNLPHIVTSIAICKATAHKAQSYHMNHYQLVGKVGS